MPLIPFPNVPKDPGVPNIPRGVMQATSDILNLATNSNFDDGFGFAPDGSPNSVDSPQWGFYDDDGNALIPADTVVTFGGVKEHRVADYPVEDGGFESYNKVEVPGEIRVRYATGIDLSSRTDMIDAVSDACDGLDLYTAVMPERTYESVNLLKYDFHREINNGVGILIIDVVGQEIRNTATQQFTQTAQPSGQDAQSGGPVQTQKLTGDDKAAVGDGAV